MCGDRVTVTGDVLKLICAVLFLESFYLKTFLVEKKFFAAVKGNIFREIFAFPRENAP